MGGMAGPMIRIFTLADGSVSQYTQQVLLDGTVYVLKLQWHSRADRWYASLSLLDGTPLVQGRAVCVGTDLLLGCAEAGRPYGLLIALPTSETGLVDPGLTGLGSGCVLCYYAVGEVTPFD
jgi:hypothetical protein